MWVIYVIEDNPNISTWCSGNISDSKPDDVGSNPLQPDRQVSLIG